MLKFTLTLGLALSFQFSQAETHIRLWRGFKQDAYTALEFKNNVARRLVPATITVGQNKGLVSYMPVFLTADQNKLEFIPDEVAIIQYESEVTYKALASTPEFSSYGKMHYENGFFTKKNNAGFGSGSLVSQTLTNEISIDLSKPSAFNFGEVDSTWKNEQVRLTAILLKDLEKDKSECLQSIITNLKESVQTHAIKGFVFAYDPKYILIYEKINSTMASTLKKQNSPSCSDQRIIELKNQTEFDEQTDGLNVNF